MTTATSEPPRSRHVIPKAFYVDGGVAISLRLAKEVLGVAIRYGDDEFAIERRGRVLGTFPRDEFQTPFDALRKLGLLRRDRFEAAIRSHFDKNRKAE